VTAAEDSPAPAGSVTQKSPAERLIGVADPKPAPSERPVARKRTAKPRPTPKGVKFVGQVWDAEETPVGYELATELAAGAK
jgi:hypothetical protein